MSNDVRWSLDLRWQRPSDPDGLWGLKKPVLMRTKDDPNMEIDWTEFDSVDRHSKQKESVADVSFDIFLASARKLLTVTTSLGRIVLSELIRGDHCIGDCSALCGFCVMYVNVCCTRNIKNVKLAGTEQSFIVIIVGLYE
jgi:hypothetical protein